MSHVVRNGHGRDCAPDRHAGRGQRSQEPVVGYLLAEQGCRRERRGRAGSRRKHSAEEDTHGAVLQCRAVQGACGLAGVVPAGHRFRLPDRRRPCRGSARPAVLCGSHRWGRSLLHRHLRPPVHLPTAVGLGRHATSEWRNWQTRQLEGLVPLGAWGFKSPLRHVRNSTPPDPEKRGVSPFFGCGRR